jgi:hypothetical protein
MTQALLVLGALALGRAAAAQTGDSIAVSAVRRHISVLAHDSLRGRGTPSRGLESAARYVVRQLTRSGLRPLGDRGSFVQRYQILRTRLDADSSQVDVRGPVDMSFRLGRQVDWLKVSEPVTRPIAGPAFLLSGLPDSAAPFAGTDVRGAVVIHLVQMDGERADIPNWLLEAAERAGVGAWILVVDRPDERWRELTARTTETRTVVPGQPGVRRFPVLEMRDRSMGVLLAESGIPHAGVRPVPRVTPALQRLAGTTVRVTLRERVLSRRSAPNVLGLVPGADSTAPAVLVAAHLDALGVGPVLGSDSIYNGADDNASGVAAALEAARLLAAGPPPLAPVVFAFFSGTEQLLLGSDFYLGNPAVPLRRTAAMVNVEAVGRNLPDSVAVVGAAQSGLTRTVDALQPAAAEMGLTVVPDPWPSRRLWLLGDHGRFREHGVPILYLFNGQHGDLHRPGDESRKIAFAAVARVGRFVALLADRLAAPLTVEGAAP